MEIASCKKWGERRWGGCGKEKGGGVGNEGKWVGEGEEVRSGGR